MVDGLFCWVTTSVLTDTLRLASDPEAPTEETNFGPLDRLFKKLANSAETTLVCSNPSCAESVTVTVTVRAPGMDRTMGGSGSAAIQLTIHAHPQRGTMSNEQRKAFHMN